MSTQYTTEPPSTSTVLIHTTAGPLTISLFAAQTPLTCRNFLQHCLDGYYDNTIFHRVAPGFVIQAGDPTGTGEGGQNIYDDKEFEKLDADWAKLLRTDEGERVIFRDEIHSRLKFNRRGLVGMAKGTGEKGEYGSQFFVTLGDCRAELDGRCTMFGRVEGEGIYNVVKIAEGELLQGTERPMYPEKILRAEVIELPQGDAWQKMRKRVRVAVRTEEVKGSVKKKTAKKKGGKAFLSFGGDEGDEDMQPTLKPRKAKFNTTLIQNVENEGDDAPGTKPMTKPTSQKGAETLHRPRNRSSSPPTAQKRKAEPVPARLPSPKRRKPSFHDPTTQLPLRNPESPSRSPESDSPHRKERRRSSTANGMGKPNLAAEIAALKASMRRDTAIAAQPTKKKSALESLIPATSTRGRKRPRPGDQNSKEDAKSMSVLDAFRARLEKATSSNPLSSSQQSKSKTVSTTSTINGISGNIIADAISTRDETKDKHKNEADDDDEEEEAQLCDLHFIANCQSCFAQDKTNALSDNDNDNEDDNKNDTNFLSHSLTFEKDRLGKDLTWKQKNEEELVVIDPRQRERDLGIKNSGKNGAGRRDRRTDGPGVVDRRRDKARGDPRTGPDARRSR